MAEGEAPAPVMVEEEIVEEPTAEGGDAAADAAAAEVVEEEVDDAVPLSGGVEAVDEFAGPPQLVDAATVRAQLRISSAFNIFDHEHNNTVDARELGTIVRALGCAPSETELNDIIVRVEEEDASGLIKYERFEPVMTEILLNQRHPTDSEETIRRAFAVLDKNKQGYLTQEDLSKALSGGGEPFSAEEIEEMMSAAVEPDRGLVYYDSHATIMALEMGADV